MPKIFNKFYLAFGSLICIACATFAQPVVPIVDSVDQHIFTYHEIEYVEDPAGKLSIEQISSQAFEDKFIANTRYKPENKNRKSTYWFRIRIKHNSQTGKNWVAEFFDQTIDHLEFYYPDKNGKHKRTVAGDEFNFDARNIWHKNFIIPLEILGDQEITYYTKVKSQQRADVMIVLRSQGWLFHYALDEYFFFGIFYGMILVFSFYNLLMFIAVRERHHLYYMLYLISLGLYEMSADGVGFQYLWPNWPAFNYYAPNLFLYFASSATMVFSASLLNLRKKNDWLFRLFIYVFLFRTAFLIMSLTIKPEWFTFRFIEVLPFFSIYYASIRSYFFDKYPPARFLVAAYTFVALAIMYKMVENANIDWKPIGELSYYSLGFSFVIEMLLLSFAISDKIRVLRLEKNEAQLNTIKQLNENQKLKDNLNSILEEQVELKTAEIARNLALIEEQNHQLELANGQLESQAQEITEINKLLSRDNVQLQHDVAEVKEARVLSKEVDFEEFSVIYPDDDSCLKFIASIKWQNGFWCKRCNHSNYSEGRSPYSKRCSRCGYDESATAYTLLQNSRLPINKAFYMIFLVYSSNGRISSHKLSEILQIRQSTCWQYSSKIKKAMREKAKAGKIRHADGWDSIIFN
ncbi:MAG: chromosome partitioning protein ParA [Bacteroidetes bacterium]|nr:chromosome partitioning protein ParA [Bacteroidota bacterium]